MKVGVRINVQVFELRQWIESFKIQFKTLTTFFVNQHRV
jgi:hypothetical protein